MLHSRVNSEERETAALLSQILNSVVVCCSRCCRTMCRAAAGEMQGREEREFRSFVCTLI